MGGLGTTVVGGEGGLKFVATRCVEYLWLRLVTFSSSSISPNFFSSTFFSLFSISDTEFLARTCNTGNMETVVVR